MSEKKRIRKSVLLGATKDGEIVFGDVEVTWRNGYREFSASFDTVRPFLKDDFDLTGYVAGYCDEMDYETLYNMCKEHDCSPNDLVDVLAEEVDDIQEWLDCSLFSSEIEANGECYLFESVGAGQQDTREEMEKYTNKNVYDFIMKMWDNYHLKEITEEQENDLLEKLNLLTDKHSDLTENWIRNYIIKTNAEQY